MEKVNKLEDKGNPEEAMKFGSSENHMQGLYFDLLACIGGGDHPLLPQGYKIKPMTGFLDIVEAFNDVAELSSAGSGTVCEVESEEFTEGPDLKSDSRETLKSRTLSSAGSDITESLQNSVHNKHKSQQQSSADSNKKFNTNAVKNKLDGTSLRGQVGPKRQNKENQKDFLPAEKNAENDQCFLDENNNICYDYTRKDAEKTPYPRENMEVAACATQENSENNEKLHNIQLGSFRSKSSYIEEIGPTLKISDSMLLDPVHQEIDAMDKEMQKYSEELREIERMLKEQLHISESSSVFSNKQTPAKSTKESARKTKTGLLPNSNSMLQTFADELISPSCALEMMYDMESRRSPCNTRNLSTFQSCTSFASCQSHPSAGNCLPNLNLDSGRASSVYIDCHNADDNSSRYDLVNPSFISEDISAGIEHTVKENDQSAYEFIDCEDGTEIMNKLVPEENTNNDVSYYSAGEETDAQEFTDAEESTSDKKRRKRKIRFSDKSSASTEDEHVWTSASGSDYEDVGDEN